MRKLVVVLVASGLIVAGCGGVNDEEKASGAVRGLLAALVDGDGQKACDLMTGDLQRRILEWPSLSGKTCAEAASAAIVIGPDERDRIDGRIRVEISGNQAAAFLEGWAQEANLADADDPWLWDGHFELLDIDGEWMVSEARLALESKLDDVKECREDAEGDIDALLECLEMWGVD